MNTYIFKCMTAQQYRRKLVLIEVKKIEVQDRSFRDATAKLERQLKNAGKNLVTVYGWTRPGQVAA